MRLPTQTKTLLIWLAPLAFAAGFAHLGYQVLKHWDVVTLDFRFFWLAGNFWTEGRNPYDSAFAEDAAARFEILKGAIWYYPPNWFPIAALLSLPGPLAASRLWSLINAALLLGASALNVAAFLQMKGRAALIAANASFTSLLRSLPPLSLFLLHAGFMGMTQAAGNTLHLGQSSMLVYFGASLLVFAAARKNDFAGGAGLALLLLKPQIGLLIAAALALSAYGRRVILLGVIVSFVLAAPAFVMTPVGDILKALLGGATEYNVQNYNLAAAMTGLRHFLWIAGVPEMGTAFYLLLALGAVCAAGLAGRRRAPALMTIDNIMIALAAALFLAPLHIYDFTIIGVMLFYGACLRPPAGAIAVAAFLLIWRAGNLPDPPALANADVTYYAGSFYASFGVCALLIAVLLSFRPRINSADPTPLAAM